MKTETYTLPEYWASALINNDYSGYSNEELAEIDNFIKKNKGENRYFMCIDANFDTLQFRWRNDANNLGGNVIDYTFDVSPLPTIAQIKKESGEHLLDADYWNDPY